MYSNDEKGLDVGLLCHGWFPDVGGVESHTRDLARELRGRGHRVHALALDYTPGREPYSQTQARVEGVDVRRMAYLYQDHRSLADVVDNWRARDVVLAWLADTRCDVVHVHHLSGFGTGALQALHEAGVPLVMTLHDYWPLCPRGQMMQPDGTVSEVPEPERCASCLAATWPHLLPSGEGDMRRPGGGEVDDDVEAAGARTAYALRSLELVQRLFTPSAAARDVYARAGVPPDRVAVCENGVAAEELAQEVERLRAEAARPPEALREVRLGVLGSVLPSKGALELARAFQEADALHLTLEIHGNTPAYHGDASYVDELRRLAEGDPRIRVHGPYALTELPRILSGLDGVAAPSRWVEVFGLTVREAAAAGLPVLVSDAGALPDVTAGGTKGIVVPAGDRAAWVEALRRFAGDREARERWAAAPARVRSAREMALQLERAYVEVVREATGLAPLLVHPVEDAPESVPSSAPVRLLDRLFRRS